LSIDYVTDIGSIINVEELMTLPSAVSWTDKPFTYYIHTIDRSLVSISMVFVTAVFKTCCFASATCSVWNGHDDSWILVKSK